MKKIVWSEEKNEWLKKERNVSFDMVALCIESEELLLDVIAHPNNVRYAVQRMFIVNICNYVYVVPFVEDVEKIFLKTIIPSRKYTKKYLGEES